MLAAETSAEKLRIISQWQEIALLNASNDVQERMNRLRAQLEEQVKREESNVQGQNLVGQPMSSPVQFVGNSKFVSEVKVSMQGASEKSVTFQLSAYDLSRTHGFSFFRAQKGSEHVLQGTVLIAILGEHTRRVVDPFLYAIGRRVGKASLSLDLASGKNRSNPVFFEWLRDKNERFFTIGLAESVHPMCCKLEPIGQLKIAGSDLPITFLAFRAMQVNSSQVVNIRL